MPQPEDPWKRRSSEAQPGPVKAPALLEPTCSSQRGTLEGDHAFGASTPLSILCESPTPGKKLLADFPGLLCPGASRLWKSAEGACLLCLVIPSLGMCKKVEPHPQEEKAISHLCTRNLPRVATVKVQFTQLITKLGSNQFSRKQSLEDEANADTFRCV